MNNKVGIITMYYNSVNYGGILQAYALQKFLTNNGFDTKQICFKKNKSNKSIKMHYKELGLMKTICWAFDRTNKKIQSKIGYKLLGNEIKEKYNERLKRFSEFRDIIGHTDKVYTSENISELNDSFNTFICGSDQIWKPGVVCPEYLLSFVNEYNIKCSYAASISKTNISTEDINKMVPYLERLDKISIREKSDAEKFDKIINKEVSWVVDPTMLLDENDWSKMCCENNICKEDYLFCYLLESNVKKYKEIKKFAKKNNLKIVTIPFSNGELNVNDNKFGDIKITEAGPRDFLGLIKNAKMVITDSFHAAVFSNIFQTNFVVLERTEAPTMNSRIISLLEMFNLKERFIQDNKLINTEIECNFNTNNTFEKMKNNSKEYLLSIFELRRE